MLQIFKTTFVAKKKLDGDVYTFSFSCKEPDQIIFTSGQYLILHVPQPDGTFKRKHFSLTSPSSQKNSFDFLLKIIPGGIASEYLMSLAEGDEVVLEGPAGMFVLKEDPLTGGKDKIFLATGTGLAPVRSIINSELLNLNSKFYLFWGIKTLEEAYFLEEFKKLTQENNNFKFWICLSREQNLDKVRQEDKQYFFLGYVTKAYEQNPKSKIQNPKSSDFYLCGDKAIVESIRQFLIAKGIPNESITFEKFV